jgi:hypothetical protein
VRERLAVGFVTGLTMTGDRERQVTFFTGAVATELLIGVDEPSMRLAYTVTEGPQATTGHWPTASTAPTSATWPSTRTTRAAASGPR